MTDEEISVVVIGHVDHGKSTLIGRMLYDTGEFGTGKLDQLESEAKSRGKKESKFAFAMDQFEEERDRLVTIDTRSRHIDLDGREFHFADAPGHRQWIRNVIMGSMFSDAALLVVRADRGPEAQTKEHTWLSKRLFGIDQMVVAIEMMDLVDYSEEKFQEVKEEVEELMDTVDEAPENIQFVPTAGYQGENIVESSDEMMWWNGPTLTDAITSFERDKPDPGKNARYLCLESFRDIQSESVLASGLMLQGSMDKGDRIKFIPSGKTVRLERIENMGDEQESIEPEDRVTIVIDDSESDTDDIKVADIQRGFFAVEEDDDLGTTQRFRSELYTCRNELEEGEKVNVWVYGRTVEATIESIENVHDAVTKEESGDDKMSLGQIADVELRLENPIIIQPIDETRSTSMFMVMDNELPVAYGNATEVL
ncbi:MAG: GTP-binding protein [Candidatus Nanohaloarchaea archaeon]